jgi:hypothetical protein
LERREEGIVDPASVVEDAQTPRDPSTAAVALQGSYWSKQHNDAAVPPYGNSAKKLTMLKASPEDWL